MKHPVFPYILLILMVIMLGSCSVGKYMKAAAKSYEIGEHYNAIEKYRKAYRSPKLSVEKPEIAFRIAESYKKFKRLCKSRSMVQKCHQTEIIRSQSVCFIMPIA